MIKCLLNIHKYFYSKNDLYKYKYNNLFLWIVSNLIVRLSQYILYYTLLLFHTSPKELNKLGNNSIAISLTSFPKRINTVWMTIDSLFHQKMMPEHIILTLSLEDFPNGKIQLPKRLLYYEKFGLEINFVNDNLKPHKKYFYVMKDHPDWTIITVDDDLYYRDNLVFELFKLHEQNPNTVCANAVHTISIDVDNKCFSPYNDWISEKNKIPCCSYKYIAIGYNGILYPNGIFSKTKYVFNKDIILNYCLDADDLWLKAVEMLNRIPVFANKYYCPPPTIPHTRKYSLMKTNTGKTNRNDIQWKNLDRLFGLYKEYLIIDKES